MISGLTKKSILDLTAEGQRIDGRGIDDYRKIKVTKGVVKNALGSAMVELGKTKIVAGIKMSIGTPYPDKPDEGSIATMAELSPMASPDFEAGPPSQASIEVSRVVDRVIREAETLDFKQLCLTPGEKVWMLNMDMYVLDMDGNLFDAGVLALMNALKGVEIPKYEDNKIIWEEKAQDLAVRGTPVAVTFAKIGDNLVVDPNDVEEELMSSRLTIGLKDNNDICAMQKGGVGEFAASDFNDMLERAQKHTATLRGFVQ